MDKCPICLDDLDESSPALPCGHRCHADCLGQLSEATGSAPTRRGLVIACPSCRQKSRVAAQTPVAAFDVGDEVYALWGHRWYPGVVDDVLEDGYEIAWDEEDASNEVPAGRVRARVQPVPVAAPRNTPEPQAAPARPPSRSLRRDPRCPCGPPPSRSLRDRRCLRRPLRTRLDPKAPAPAKKDNPLSEEALERQRARSRRYKRKERKRERAREAKKQKRLQYLRENYPNQRADDGDADDAPARTPEPAVDTCVETPFTAPCGFTYDGTPTAALVPADESRKYTFFCCAASGKPAEKFVGVGVQTIKDNLKFAKSALPFASRTVQSSLPPKLKHLESILAACQGTKATMLKCNIKCRSSVHDMIQFRRTLSMLPPEFAHHSMHKRQKIARALGVPVGGVQSVGGSKARSQSPSPERSDCG